MTSVWFIVPAHGRHHLAAVCLAQLARTIDALNDNGVRASAVVVACDENLDTARALGLGTVESPNDFLGRRFNDGIQFATDPEHNPHPVDYVIPCGSDDWVDPQLILTAPLGDTSMTCFRRAAFVDETGTRLARLTVDYAGGFGIRIIPRALVAAARYRPADDDKKRACDTSILRGLHRAVGRQPEIVYHDLHPFQLVDWKTEGGNLNTFEMCLRYAGDPTLEDPFEALAGVYPADALDQMRAVYQPQPVAA